MKVYSRRMPTSTMWIWLRMEIARVRAVVRYRIPRTAQAIWVAASMMERSTRRIWWTVHSMQRAKWIKHLFKHQMPMDPWMPASKITHSKWATRPIERLRHKQIKWMSRYRWLPMIWTTKNWHFVIHSMPHKFWTWTQPFNWMVSQCGYSTAQK